MILLQTAEMAVYVCVLLLVDPLLKHGTAALYTGFLGHGGISWSLPVLPIRLQIIYNSLFIIILPFDIM
jgi:hypothetical protein